MELKITELKKYLLQKSDKELREEIVELFKISNKVKEYYSLKVSPDYEKELLNKYKKIIVNQFFPERGMKFPSYAVLKKAISDFKKVSKNAVYIADLMLLL